MGTILSRGGAQQGAENKVSPIYMCTDFEYYTSNVSISSILYSRPTNHTYTYKTT